MDSPADSITYPRGSAAFDRVIFFSDAIFAIAITLVAVEIGIPELDGGSSSAELWSALVAKVPSLAAYAFTFFWVAFYWRANHKFSAGLRGMDGGYIVAVLIYLAFIALLPFPAATLGEYYNAVALSFFLLFMACVSTMEVVLLVVANRRRLLEAPLAGDRLRFAVVASLVPVASALVAIPISFLSVPVAVVGFFALALGLGAVVNRTLGRAEEASE